MIRQVNNNRTAYYLSTGVRGDGTVCVDAVLSGIFPRHDGTYHVYFKNPDGDYIYAKTLRSDAATP